MAAKDPTTIDLSKSYSRDELVIQLLILIAWELASSPLTALQQQAIQTQLKTVAGAFGQKP